MSQVLPLSRFGIAGDIVGGGEFIDERTTNSISEGLNVAGAFVNPNSVMRNPSNFLYRVLNRIFEASLVATWICHPDVRSNVDKLLALPI
jgi:hypothetical protein